MVEVLYNDGLDNKKSESDENLIRKVNRHL